MSRLGGARGLGVERR